MPRKNSSLRTSEIGKAGEKLAVRALRRAGYRVLTRNFRARGGEIDVVADHRGTIVFVEVKTRRSDSFASPELSVNSRKRRNLARAAWYFLELNSLTERDCRFDIVSIVNEPQSGRPKVEIIPNAFEVDIWHR
ncbi:MAG: YraN family protein [Candidatus Hydrogenedentes bacterium]|nr:YraN family protein [Candidatus Hydrogenedentota bacterium]